MIIDYPESKLDQHIKFALVDLTQKQCKEVYQEMWPDAEVDKSEDLKQALEKKLKAEFKE